MSFETLKLRAAETLAQVPSPQVPVEVEAPGTISILTAHLLAAVVFSIVGILVFGVCLFVMDRLTPFSIVKEIGEDHNQALGTIIAGVVIGISIIIAAAILG